MELLGTKCYPMGKSGHWRDTDTCRRRPVLAHPGIQCWKFYNFWIDKVIFFHLVLGFTGQLVVQSFIFLTLISSLWHITSELDSETITLFFSSLLSGLAYLHKWRQKWWKLWNMEETFTVGILRSNCFCFCFWGPNFGQNPFESLLLLHTST